MSLRPIALVLSAALIGGCYQHHERGGPTPRDAGARPDAGRFLDTGVLGRDGGPPVRRDAGPPIARDGGPRDGDFWTLERRAGELFVPHEVGCDQLEGGRIAVRVAVALETTCEYMGPVEVLPGDATEFVIPHVWVRHRADPTACVPVNVRGERTLTFEAFESGLRVAMLEGDSRISVDVPAVDGRPCSFAGGDGSACLQDCDCADDRVCIPEVGDFVACEGGRCGRPCNSNEEPVAPYYGAHLDCAPDQQCRFGPAAAAPSCQPIADDGCSDDCGPGLVCLPTGEATECGWSIRLTGMNRHECASDIDCENGLVCVHRLGEIDRCEVPCFQADMRCPPMHHCEAPRWVCEWDGE